MMFQLYRDAARIQVWGETSGVNTFGDTGTGIPVPITVYGRVPPQTAPTAGSYLAQITATITY
jgi:spore coat protein U-like protein